MKNVIANTIPIHRHSLCVYFSILSLIAATLSKLVPRRPSSGKEFREVATVTQVVWNLFEDILHPRTRFNAGILAGTYQRVHYCCAICGGIVAAEEPVFSSQSQRVNGSLNRIVVDGYPGSGGKPCV